MTAKLAFISYRRDDEGPASRFIKGELERHFGNFQIFMDVDNIRAADKWQEIIEENLQKANVLIVTIGKNWLKIQDENFRRRIDNADDWVRKEIEFALSHGIKIIPLLLGGDLPKPEALPESIQQLMDFQFLSLSAINWRDGLSRLFSLLQDLDFQPIREYVVYPIPISGMLFPIPLTLQQIEYELKTLKDWNVVDYITKGKNPLPGEAIEKYFKFDSFEQAIEFVNIVAKHISAINHHPEWENIWITLRIRLSTWDIGHKVSNLDIELAKFIEKEFDLIPRRKIDS